MIKARIAIVLLVVMLMFVAYVNDRQARVIEQQRKELKMLLQTIIHGGNHA